MTTKKRTHITAYAMGDRLGSAVQRDWGQILYSVSADHSATQIKVHVKGPYCEGRQDGGTQRTTGVDGKDACRRITSMQRYHACMQSKAINAESLKITCKTFWYPMGVAMAVVATIASITGMAIKLLL
jgi:hypothetical protein